jgi:arginase
MPAMKIQGKSGLIFFDAHADFYEPIQSTTGEVADMDLGIVTGRGPDILTNIDGLKPYVKDEHVIHVGQKDGEEAARFGSRDIKDTEIRCFAMSYIDLNGIDKTIEEIISCVASMNLNSFWLHFDTDVLYDGENPAVDYRLPGGVKIKDAGHLINSLLKTGMIAGMSVTIFNPSLDRDGSIAGDLVDCIAGAFIVAHE